MGRPKKVKEEKEPKFKRSEFHAFFPDFYYDEVIPYFLEHKNRIVELSDKWVDRTQTKEEWQELYKYMLELMEIFNKEGRKPVIAYARDYLVAKYHINHSQYYKHIADKEIQFMHNRLDAAEKYIEFQDRTSNPKEYSYWSGAIIVAAQHFWFYMNAKEKLGITE